MSSSSVSVAPDDHAKPWETTRRGLMLLVSSPAGAGKTSLSRRLAADHLDLILSISATTRAPRPGEEEAREYFFKTREEFDAMIAAGELFEWAEVNGQRYGTPRAPVMAALEAGKDVLFDIDWQGAQQLSEKMPGDVVRVFVLPPSGPVLEERLRVRAQDSPETVARRMAAASSEISHWPEYDYVIVNSDLETSVNSALAILTAERLKRARLLGLSAFVRDMRAVL